MSTRKIFAAQLRELADLLVEHSELETFPELFEAARVFSVHEFGDQAAQLDVFAGVFGATIEHRVHKSGDRYSSVETEIDGRCFRLQAYTEDYEKATGKKIERSTVGLPVEQVAELEHWAANPLPRDAGSTP